MKKKINQYHEMLESVKSLIRVILTETRESCQTVEGDGYPFRIRYTKTYKTGIWNVQINVTEPANTGYVFAGFSVYLGISLANDWDTRYEIHEHFVGFPILQTKELAALRDELIDVRGVIASDLEAFLTQAIQEE